MRERRQPQRSSARTQSALAGIALLASALVLPAAAPAGGSSAVDAVFVIDNSGSMKRNDPDFITHRLVLEFSDALSARGSDARVAMVVFDRDARLVEPLSPIRSEGARERLAAGLEQVDFRGQRTNSAEGIERALYELRTRGRADANRIVVFLTDGVIDTGDPAADLESSRWLRDTLAGAAARAGVRIFGIAFTESADFELIQTLALKTEGEYFRAFRAEEIPGVVGDILERALRSAEPSLAKSARDPRPTEAGRSASPAPLPAPVSSASPGRRLPFLAWAALGSLALAAALAAAALRSRREERRAAGAAADSPGPAPAHNLPPAAIPERSSAVLLDVMRASRQGVLPLSMERGLLRVGRDESNDIVIARDTISSFHATIELREGYYYVEDHRSTNGTTLNGVALAPNQPMPLKSGDRIDFAEYEFRFLIPDQIPSGKTVLLGGSSLVAEASEGPGAQEGLPPPSAGEADLFRACLEGHLRRIADLGERYARFVEEGFGPACIDRLASHVDRLMAFSGADRKGRIETFASGEVMYVLCVVPHSMRRAAAWFGEHYGGFTKLLGRYLDAPEFQRSTAKVLCAVTYGRSRDAWVSVTLAPGDECKDPIDIMSIELLSADERRALALHFNEVGQVL